MIREFRESDTERVNELLSEFSVKIEDIINREFLTVLVYVDNEIDGVLVYDLIYDRIEIEYIVVDKQKRKKGIATKLVEFMELNNKASNITLEVKKSNEVAIQFYKSLGFKSEAIRKNYYNGEDGILMMKLGR